MSDRPITYRGKILGPSTLEEIRRLARSSNNQSRTEIARRVCRRFDWRRPNGERPVRSCLQLLVRLDRRGFLRLPPSQAGPRRKRPRRRNQETPGAHESFEAPRGTHGLEVRPTLLHERELWRRLMDDHHYLGYRQPPGESLCYVALWNGEPMGLVGWASATLDNGARERWIGWDRELKHRACTSWSRTSGS